MPVFYDFREPQSDRHYVIPPYGPPAGWPDGVPSPRVPTYPYVSRHAGDIPRKAPDAVLIRPFGQETPVRRLGELGEEKWGDKHPLQKTFAENTIELAREQPWVAGLILLMGGALALKALSVFGGLGGK